MEVDGVLRICSLKEIGSEAPGVAAPKPLVIFIPIGAH
jgi:hypothetical protein